jgi:hypothetical protein
MAMVKVGELRRRIGPIPTIGENSALTPVVETVGSALYLRLDRKDYGL